MKINDIRKFDNDNHGYCFIILDIYKPKRDPNRFVKIRYLDTGEVVEATFLWIESYSKPVELE